MTLFEPFSIIQDRAEDILKGDKGGKTTVKQDQLTIITKDWKPGVYIATLINDGSSIESVKFTLMK